MSRLVQIDVAKFDGGAQKLFSSRNLGQTLLLQDDQGATFEVTHEDSYTSNARRTGGPVRTFDAFVKDLDGSRTIFRYAALKVYKGYGSVLLQVE
jgi:hypothetical protein